MLTWWVVVIQAFNPSIWEIEAGESLEFEANLIYRVSSKTTSTVIGVSVLPSFCNY